MTTTPRPIAPIARHGHSLWPRLLCGHAGADIPAPRDVGQTGSWPLSVTGKKCPDRAPVGMSGRSAIRRACTEAAYGHGMAVGDQKWGHGAHREGRHPRPPTPPSLRALTVTMGAHLRGGGPFAEDEDGRPSVRCGHVYERVPSPTGLSHCTASDTGRFPI